MNCNCNPNRSARRCIPCAETVIGFFAVLRALAIGVIVGAVNYETFLPVLAAVIVFAVVIAVIIIALLIYWFRCSRSSC